MSLYRFLLKKASDEPGTYGGMITKPSTARSRYLWVMPGGEEYYGAQLVFLRLL